MNMIKKIQSLFGIGEYTKRTDVLKVTRKIFFNKGRWSVVASNEATTIQTDRNSIGYAMLGKAPLEFFQITEVTMTFQEVQSFFGIQLCAIEKDNGRVVLQSDYYLPVFTWLNLTGTNTVKFNLGATVPENIMAKLIEMSFSMLMFSKKWMGGKKKSFLIPAHPGWVFRNGVVNLLVSDRKIEGVTAENLIRSGKDIWNKVTHILSTPEDPIRILVLPSTGTAEGDGRIMLTRKAGKDYKGLVRAILTDPSGKFGILKGRVLSTDMFLEMPNGKMLPSNLDGWTTTDNLKWLPKVVLKSLEGKVLRLDNLYGVQDEDHKIQENGYKFHSLALILMQMSQETRVRMEKAFRSFWKRAAAKMSQMSIEQMIDSLKDETDGFVLSSQAVKLLLGVATPEDRTAVETAFAKKFLSMRIKGSEYPMIIFARTFGGIEVTPDSPVYSQEMFDRLTKDGKTEGTFARYPLLNHQSYLRVQIEKSVQTDMGVDIMVLHPDCAKPSQADEDDHGQIQTTYLSEFRTSSGEEVLVVKPSIRDGFPSEYLAYLKGAKAQGSIGLAFNAMVKALVSNQPILAKEATIAINSFAQGVKKDAVLPEASELTSAGLGFANALKKGKVSFEMNLAGLITSKGKPEIFAGFASELGFNFGFNLPTVKFQYKDKVYKNKITNFVQAKLVMSEKTQKCVVAAGFETFEDLRTAIRKDASLWSAGDFEKVALFFLEYAKMAEGFRGYTFHQQSGLLASQLEGKYLAIYTLLKG